MIYPLLFLLLFVLALAFFFAKLEIAIEGDAGWATSLPTWRIENHWALDWFWGGRAMTGYHAWAFSLVALFFHLPLVFGGTLSWSLEWRALGSNMLFWVAEDFLWFVLNPAFGLRRFSKLHVNWHKNWVFGAPVEYWIFLPVGLALIWVSYFPA